MTVDPLLISKLRYVVTAAAVIAFMVSDAVYAMEIQASQRKHVKVVYVANPRFRQWNADRFERLLGAAIELARRELSVELHVDAVKSEWISSFLSSYRSRFSVYKPLAADLRGEVDRDRLLTSTEKWLRDIDEPLTVLRGFSKSAGVKISERITYRSLASDVSRAWASGARRLANARLKDGSMLVDATYFNEYLVWSTLGLSTMPYDVVITDQPIVSIEYGTAGLHTSLRGGLTLGLTAPSKSLRHGGYSVVSLFPFSRELPELRDLQQVLGFSEADAEKFAAALLVHELGHLFFRYGHVWSGSGCIMRPIPGLRFQEWYDDVMGNVCDTLKHKAMKQGSTTLGEPY